MNTLSNRAALSALVAAAFCAPVLAQIADHPIDIAPISIDQLRGGDYVRRAYTPRTDLIVYDVGLPTISGGDFRSSGVNVYDDVTFGGPGASGPITINGIGFGIGVPVTATPPDDHLFMKVSFYPFHDSTVVPSAYPYSGTPVVWDLDLGAGWSQGGGLGNPATFDHTVLLNDTNVFNGGPTDRTCGVKQQLFLDAAETRTADNWQLVRRGNIAASGAALNIPVGSTDLWSWFSAATNPGSELTNSQRSGGSIPNNRATYLVLQGTGYTWSPPPLDFDFGPLSDAGASRAITLVDNTTNWYSFSITSAAIDGLEHFLDIDTEGSTADTAIALYDSAGHTVQVDTDSGSGTNSQLSFGMGRRSAIGNGKQYDGRNFYAPAAGLPAGTYYLAVTPQNHIAGPAQLNFHTNVNGAPLAASVPPAIATGDDLGNLTSPGVEFPPSSLPGYSARWIRFNTCSDATATAPIYFDWPGTSTPTFSATIFDASGNFIHQMTTSTVGLPPRLTILSGMPAGTYYLALSYAAVQIQPNNPATDGRWHLRPTSGNDGFFFSGQISAPFSFCPQPPCSPDFNGDGDPGTDQDIEAFFACLAGNCCNTCGSADYNGDGDSGTDQDIESFFRVLAGGNC